MKLTVNVLHPEYGNLTLTGQYQPYEADTGTPEGVELESVSNEHGQELYLWDNGKCLSFGIRDILEMEAALLHRGEPVVSRAKPTKEILAWVRDALALPRATIEIGTDKKAA